MCQSLSARPNATISAAATARGVSHTGGGRGSGAIFRPASRSGRDGRRRLMRAGLSRAAPYPSGYTRGDIASAVGIAPVRRLVGDEARAWVAERGLLGELLEQGVALGIGRGVEQDRPAIVIVAQPRPHVLGLGLGAHPQGDHVRAQLAGAI